MPKRDGVAVVQRVLELHPKACLLIMTTYDGDEDIFQCLSQGAKGYLLKSAIDVDLVGAIKAVADGQRASDRCAVRPLDLVVEGDAVRLCPHGPTLSS